jgi:hypothetical protein
MVVTTEEIDVGESGECTFLEGKFSELAPSGEPPEEMYNLILTDSIKAGVNCLAVPAGAINSEEDGWVLVWVDPGTTTTRTFKNCFFCLTGVIPSPISITISGIADDGGGSPPAGTAALVNGTHSVVADDASNPFLTGPGGVVADGSCQLGKKISDSVNGGNIYIILGAQPSGWNVRFIHDTGAFNESKLVAVTSPTGSTGLGPQKKLICTEPFSGVFSDGEWAWATASGSPATPVLDFSAFSMSITP